ncbi:MAG: SfiI family type II restriction endonuclease [Chloroflexi bacterium]|nr:SfiI family type II restriction endonuclease [Chloroflexota bacterium]
MAIDPHRLETDLDLVEAVERASLRLVVQAVYGFLDEAREIFRQESDLVADIGEDITREALDRLGTSVIPIRLFGKIDYKRARYIFHPDYSVLQALFVDSKAEKVEGQRTATIQTAQTSMHIRQVRSGVAVDEPGTLPKIIERGDQHLLTTTIFVKYNYREVPSVGNDLESVTLACLPNGILQNRYNPSASDTFWLVGRNAPTRGEEFRARISFDQLKRKASWRVQYMDGHSQRPFRWED